ncbi:glutamic acid-rich protein-like [Uranotaenia lowii]|uniref:glutamic acid-rich protein-like n=1 Tax=Uranotaenia lowii TaxID=190385 RepID=UPI002478FB56|nr:glutamic acid-rich protein-like [Uranotaenia lowii]
MAFTISKFCSGCALLLLIGSIYQTAAQDASMLSTYSQMSPEGALQKLLRSEPKAAGSHFGDVKSEDGREKNRPAHLSMSEEEIAFDTPFTYEANSEKPLPNSVPESGLKNEEEEVDEEEEEGSEEQESEEESVEGSEEESEEQSEEEEQPEEPTDDDDGSAEGPATEETHSNQSSKTDQKIKLGIRKQ